MRAYAVPSWEQNVEIVEFKPVNQSNKDATEKKTKVKKPKKKKQKKAKATSAAPTQSGYRVGQGPLAPPPDSSDDEVDDEMRAMRKVKAGRIEKTRPPAQQAKKNLQPMLLKPALLKAAVESMDITVTPTNIASSAPTLVNKLQAELLGGRFRYINEQLYTMNSHKAEKLFQADNSAFEAYHAGYRQQVDKWPKNPLARIIKTIKRLPKTAIIGDFGCGEGKLAQSVPNKVYSMDLVSTRNDIIACNITATPLQPQSIDVAVYCLSLMGTNLTDFLLEANRVLKLHGNVYIAEIQSRFEDIREFMRFMTACGFDLIKKDVAVNFFYFFHFKKMRNVGKVANIKPFSLKPCLYRKR